MSTIRPTNHSPAVMAQLRRLDSLEGALAAAYRLDDQGTIDKVRQDRADASDKLGAILRKEAGL